MSAKSIIMAAAGATPASGATWAAQSSGTTSNLRSVAASGVRVVAVGLNGAINYSEDGVLWTNNPLGADNFSSIVWDGVRFSFVGTSITGRSTDGIAFSSTPNALGDMQGVASSGSIYVMAGLGLKAYSSPDALNWTSRIADFGTDFYGVGYSPTLSLFVICGSSGSTGFRTSSDGINWTTQTNPSISTKYRVIWANGSFVAVGGTEVVTSPDGVNWTIVARGTTIGTGIRNTAVLRAIAWSPTTLTYVAVGATSGEIYTSTDLANWTPRSSGTTQSLFGVCWVPHLSKFIVVGNAGTILTAS